MTTHRDLFGLLTTYDVQQVPDQIIELCCADMESFKASYMRKWEAELAHLREDMPGVILVTYRPKPHPVKKGYFAEGIYFQSREEIEAERKASEPAMLARAEQLKAEAMAPARRRSKTPRKQAETHGTDESRDPLRTFYDGIEGLDEQLRFLREHGLEPEDIGRRNWAGANSEDSEVQRHQAVFGRNPQEYGRAIGIWGVTPALSTKQFRQGYEAIALANHFGCVLNTFLTITWPRVGVTEPTEVAEANGRYLELLRKACRKHGKPYLLIWVLENGKTHGLHSHILMSMPKADKPWLRKQVELAVQTITGRDVHWRLGTRAVRLFHRRDRDVTAQWRLFRYMMKGIGAPKERRLIDPAASRVPAPIQIAARLKLRSQGTVETKRFGVSRVLDAKSVAAIRAEYGIPPSYLEQGETDPNVLFSTDYLDVWDEATRQAREAAEREEFERMKTELLNTLAI